MSTEGVRLAKCVARMLPCSRREAELYITGGWVRVDGQVIEEPQFKILEQRIELDPQAKAEPVELVTLILHQGAADAPTLDAGATDARDPGDPVDWPAPATRSPLDASGLRMLKGHFKRLVPTLPLEAGAEGLAVFTQDWRVVRRLTEDRDRIEQEYNVEVAGDVADGGLDRLHRGLQLDGRTLPPAKVSWQSEQRLRFAVKGLQPGQIRLSCEHLGLTVLRLKRIRIGRVSMGKLAAGQWRYLAAGERFA